MTKSFAIIPARAGSKRIPNKNIQLINGRPLIAFPILAALNSGIFDDVIVSTDSQRIAEIARSFGASVPFIRDAKISDDFTPTIPVIRDAISKLPEVNEEDIITCIYPTSIFVTPDLLKKAYPLTHSLKHRNFVVTFTSFPYPIQRALRMDSENKLNFISAENANMRSQDLETTYHDAAQFYMARACTWKSEESVFNEAVGVEISRKYVQDIDTFEDLENARYLINMIEHS